MPEALVSSISAWTYAEAGIQSIAGSHWADPSQFHQSEAIPQGVPEQEVTRRIAEACDIAFRAAQAEMEQERRRTDQGRNEQLCVALQGFAHERSAYFQRVEEEVVRLALAIARKILEREAVMDPSLLGALVRIALERMQAGPGIRVRVAPAEVEHWRTLNSDVAGTKPWDVIADESLAPGDCQVETEMGVASFGFEAQLASVEHTLQHLLATRPRG